MKPVKAYFSEDKILYDSIKNIFGYYPGNIHLYKLALRHKSASIEEAHGLKISNERLEYLGDAILGAIVADFLFKLFPYKDEGFLTQMRSKIVSRSQLNKLSRKLGLHKLVKIHGNDNNHYRSINGDAFEAFVGAMYLDKGYKFSKKIIINHVIRIGYNIDELQETDFNYKSKLIEWAQKNRHEVEFRLIGEEGKGYNRQYIVQVFINHKAYQKGFDYSIKGAEQNASERTWKIIQTENQ
ncbi:MAG: ribonuclease III [Bacteroidetes bacterium]|nr:MAG: ribonuclease III [Bacteroidota bacterium]PIE88567.1 MAG: ribonuclease III [Bacteroidota bacterium]